MTCVLDPELNPDDTALFYHIYRRASEYLATRGHLPPMAFFRAGVLPRLPTLKPGQVAMLEIEMPGNDTGKDCVAEMLPGGQNWSAWIEISRDACGRPSIPADPPSLEYLTADGRFANILDGNGNLPSRS